MKALAGSLLVLSMATAAAADGISVHAAGGRVDLLVTAAPLDQVLDAVAAQTGMRVVYGGHRPRSLVAADFTGVTEARAVFGLLEGLGLDYLVTLDASGERVATLVFLGSDGSPGLPAGPSRVPAAAGDSAPATPVRPLASTPAAPATVPPAAEGEDEEPVDAEIGWRNAPQKPRSIVSALAALRGQAASRRAGVGGDAAGSTDEAVAQAGRD